MATKKSTTNQNSPASAPADLKALDARIGALESKLDQLLAAFAAQSRTSRRGGAAGSGPTLAELTRQPRILGAPVGETAASASRGASFASFLFNGELCVQNGKVTVRFVGDESAITVEELLAAGGRIQLDLSTERLDQAVLPQQLAPGGELSTLLSLFNFLTENDLLVRGVAAGAQCPPGECPDNQD